MREHLGHVGLAPHIGDHGLGHAALLVDDGGRLLKLGVGAGGQHDLAALPGEGQGGRPANAASGSGHHRDLSNHSAISVAYRRT